MIKDLHLMHAKGLTYLRAPGKLIQVGVTTGQSLYRAELDEMRLAVISQWPQLMRNRADTAQELSLAVEKAKHFPDGVICLYFQVIHNSKPSIYVEYINVNLLESMGAPALIEKSRTQIPLFCWLLQKQLNGPTGWEHLTNSAILSGGHAVGGFGAARLYPASSFAPWGSALVTQENVFPDLLTDQSIAEKDYLVYLHTSKLFDQLRQQGGEGDIPILWSQSSRQYEEGSANLVLTEDSGAGSRRKMLILVAAAVLVSFIGSWMISTSTRTQAAPRMSGAPEVAKEMQFFLWNRPTPKPEVKPIQAPQAPKFVPAKKTEIDNAAIQRAEQEQQARQQEEAARKKSEALKALGLSQSGDDEKKKSEALKALTNSR